MTARKCMCPIAGQDPGSTATSRCSQSQAQDGHDGIGSDVAPAKRYFKVHWPNRSSFFPVDWHSDHHKKKTCPGRPTLNEIVNACHACGSSARRRSNSNSSELVVRHFLVGAAAWPRSRDHDVRARGQAHLDAILSLLPLAQTSPISPHSLETDLYVRFQSKSLPGKAWSLFRRDPYSGMRSGSNVFLCQCIYGSTILTKIDIHKKHTIKEGVGTSCSCLHNSGCISSPNFYFARKVFLISTI